MGLILSLAGVAIQSDVIWIIAALTLAIAFASASQDIAIDAYAVEVLRREEQGVVVGARIALYRAAMFVAGGLTITLAGHLSWPFVFVLLALLYAPFMVITWFSPRPEASQETPPPKTLQEAVWKPFVGFLSVHRSLEILTFVVLYKLADNLAGALVRPFLVQTGFSSFDVGVATASIGLIATLAGTFLGGMLTTAWGLGHALWIFGALQILSNLGYVMVAEFGVNRLIMYGAMGFESLTTGMGTGAFSVLLLRMTQRRFSATQYALFSGLFALPRMLSGPVTGVMVDAIGWRDFFLFTMVVGLPGMAMLQRFSPLGVREPNIDMKAKPISHPIGRRGLSARAIVGGIVGLLCGVLTSALLGAMKSYHRAPESGFDILTPLAALLNPHGISGWVQLVGILMFSLVIALATAATAAARSGGQPGQ